MNCHSHSIHIRIDDRAELLYSDYLVTIVKFNIDAEWFSGLEHELKYK